METFWRLSLRELWREFAVAARRIRDRQQRDRGLAWEVAYLSRIKAQHFPAFDVWTGVKTKPPRQTPGQMKAMVHLIAEMTGTEVTTKTQRDAAAAAAP